MSPCEGQSSFFQAAEALRPHAYVDNLYRNTLEDPGGLHALFLMLDMYLHDVTIRASTKDDFDTNRTRLAKTVLNDGPLCHVRSAAASPSSCFAEPK